MTSTGYRPLFDEILQDLIRSTHCHSCGIKSNVCFFGYMSENCTKPCWKRHGEEYYEPYDDDSIGHDPDNCKWCDSQRVSCANSLRHYFHNIGLSPTGHIWPMMDPSVPCENECIKTMPTIKIKGYND